MKKNIIPAIFVAASFLLYACNNKKAEQPDATAKTDTPVITKADSSFAAAPDSAATRDKLNAFIPGGYVLFETITGDLNKDNIPDKVLVIKGTDKKNIIKDEYRGTLDRNRRGLVVLLNKNGEYELLVKNHECFASENEDGGVYFAPELSVEIKDAKLFIHYGHGRYGYWSYTLRPVAGDMELVGYDASSHTGPLINRETSINFLTRKKQVRKNTNEDAGPGEEIFEETWSTIHLKAPLRLSAIKGFDEMEMYDY